MSETGIIKIQQRGAQSTGELNRLRKEGVIPANICQKGAESVSVSVGIDELKKAISKYGRNSVYRLELPDGNHYNAIIKKIQKKILTNAILHVEFQKISLDEEIKAEVPIVLTGREIYEESKNLMLNVQTDSITVKGLPQTIPDHIEVSVSGMQPGDSILIGDLKLPEGLTTDADPERKIVTLSEARKSSVAAAEADKEEKTSEAESPETESETKE